jgi:hypothetical protein
MKKLLLITTCLISTLEDECQNLNFQWAKQVGGSNCFDQAYSVDNDQLGNVYVIGSFTGISDLDPGPGTFTFQSNGGLDIYILKLDSLGNFIWAKQFGASADDYGVSIFVDGSNSIFATGYFNGIIDFDPGVGTYTLNGLGFSAAFISKLDAAGNFIMAKQFTATNSAIHSNCIKVDQFGNIIVAGTNNYGAIDFDPGPATYTLAGGQYPFVCKLDNLGNLMWVKQFEGGGGHDGCSVDVDAVGNIYSTGVFQDIVDFDPGPGTYTLSNYNTAGIKDAFVSKLDPLGNFVWAKQLGGRGYDQGNSIKVDGLGFVYSAGFFEDTVDFDPGLGIYQLISNGEWDIYISKLDSNGNFIWANSLGGTKVDVPYSIDLDGSGNVYTTGEFRHHADFDPGPGGFNLNSHGRSDVFISVLDNSGSYIWSASMGDTAQDSGNSIMLDQNGNIYTVGYFQYKVDFDTGPAVQYKSSIGNFDAFVHKVDHASILGNKKIASTNQCAVYPNPASDIIYIKNLDKTSIVTIEDVFGKILEIKPEENEVRLRELPIGIYLLKIQTFSSSRSFKIIKAE